MRKLYEILKILQIQKRMFSAGSIHENMVAVFFRDYMDTYTCMENTFAFSNFQESYQKH